MREPHEYKIAEIGGYLIPLGDLPKRVGELDRSRQSWPTASGAVARKRRNSFSKPGSRSRTWPVVFEPGASKSIPEYPSTSRNSYPERLVPKPFSGFGISFCPKTCVIGILRGFASCTFFCRAVPPLGIRQGARMDLVIIRVLFILVLTAACFFLRPFALQPWAAAVLGAVSAAAVIVFELRVRPLSIKRLLGAVLGSVLGIAGAALFGMVLSGSLPPGGTRALLQLFVLMLMSYIGLMVGASKGDLLNFTGAWLSSLPVNGLRPASATSRSSTPAPLSTAASPMWWIPASWKEH